MTHALIAPAVQICGLIQEASDRKVAQEVLVLDQSSVAIVVDVEGVDFILTMMRLPVQRPRPTEQ